MKIAVFVLVALAFAGCAGPAGNETASEVPESPDSKVPIVIAGDHEVFVEAETKNETFRVTVNLLRDATVSVDVDEVPMLRADSVVGENIWDITILEGNHQIRVLVDDGETQEETFTVARLSEGTMIVDFGGYPGGSNTEATIWFNLDGAYSADQYTDRDVDHPGYGTVHDFMVEWENQIDLDIEYAYSGGLGYSVSTMDGIGSPLSGAPPYWLYTVNEQSPSLGISGEAMLSGAIVEWCLNACS